MTLTVDERKMSQTEQEQNPQQLDVDTGESASNVGGEAGQQTGPDKRSEDEVKADNELAVRLSILIENANEKVVPLVRMIRKVIV